jgi:hypothetical protein
MFLFWETTWFNLGWSDVSKNLFISSRFSNLFGQIFKVAPDDTLDFLGACCHLPLFTSDCIIVSLSPSQDWKKK